MCLSFIALGKRQVEGEEKCEKEQGKAQEEDKMPLPPPFGRIFSGPESDHWLPMSVFNRLTNSLLFSRFD